MPVPGRLRQWLGRLWEGWMLAPLLYLLDSVILALPHRRPATTDSVALVRLDAIGDFVLWLPSARALVAEESGVRMVLFANSAWADYARTLGYWDSVVAIDPKRFRLSMSYRFGTSRRVRAGGFSRVINPTFSRHFSIDDALVRMLAAPESVGWESEGTNLASWQIACSNALYSRRIVPAAEPCPEGERNAEFVRKLCGKTLGRDFSGLPVLAPAWRSPVSSGDYFVIAPGASWGGKTWPRERFAVVMRLLARRTGWVPVMLGSSSEREVCADVLAASGLEGLELAGVLSLAEAVECVRGARQVLANDSALVHIAAAVGVPSVCILGGGHFGRFLPYQEDPSEGSRIPQCVYRRMKCYGCRWQCRLPHRSGGPMPCVEAVSVAQVVEVLGRSLPGPEAVPLLAVVIPVFDDPQGLRASLESLRAARRPDAMLTLVVDDGSPSAIEAGEGDDAIGLRIIRLPINQGIERALNAGVEEARRLGATFIARLDAGDTVDEDRLISQLRVLESDPEVGLVGSSARFVDLDGNTLFVFQAPETDRTIRRRMHINSCILHPTAMFRVSVLDQVGDYSTQFPAAEDYELFFRMLRHCKAACLPQALVTTVHAAGGISARRRRAQLVSRLRIQRRHFDSRLVQSYIGIATTLLLLAVPNRLVLGLKRSLGISRY